MRKIEGVVFEEGGYFKASDKTAADIKAADIVDIRSLRDAEIAFVEKKNPKIGKLEYAVLKDRYSVPGKVPPTSSDLRDLDSMFGNIFK